MPGSTWEGSEAVLDASWTSLGLLLAALGRLVDPRGRFLAAAWALSDVTWLISNAFWVHFSSPGRSGPRFWRVWGHAALGFETLGKMGTQMYMYTNASVLYEAETCNMM